MADGDLVLDPAGNIVVDSSGNDAVEDSSADCTNCCKSCDSDTCVYATVDFEGISGLPGCINSGLVFTGYPDACLFLEYISTCGYFKVLSVPSGTYNFSGVCSGSPYFWSATALIPVEVRTYIGNDDWNGTCGPDCGIDEGQVWSPAYGTNAIATLSIGSGIFEGDCTKIFATISVQLYDLRPAPSFNLGIGSCGSNVGEGMPSPAWMFSGGGPGTITAGATTITVSNLVGTTGGPALFGSPSDAYRGIFNTGISSGGTATITLTCTPPTTLCYHRYDALCEGTLEGLEWSVTYVDSVCSANDISHDWIPLGNGDRSHQVKVVASETACDICMSECSNPDSDPDPPETACADFRCVWHFVATVQCKATVPVWVETSSTALCKNTAGIAEHDWTSIATDDDGNVIAMDKIQYGDNCDSGGCSSQDPPSHSLPTATITADPCDGICLYRYIVTYDCARKMWGEVALDTGSGYPICKVGATSTAWTYDAGDSTPDFPQYARFIAGPACIGRPGSLDTCPSIELPAGPSFIPEECGEMVCLYTFEVDYDCGVGPDPLGPAFLVSATCGLDSDAHDWSLFDVEDNFHAFRKIIAGASCTADGDCTDAPDAPLPPTSPCI